MPHLSHSCTDCPVSDCLIARYCSPEWKSMLDKHNTIVFYKTGQQIIYEKYPVDGIYFIRQGKAKVYKSGINGQQQTIRLAKSGDILGHRGMNRKYWPISSSTLEDSYICFIPKDIFENILMNNLMMTYHLLLFFTNELYHSEKIIKALALFTVCEKVAYSLLKIDEAFASENDKTLGAQLSRKDIAEIAGTTKEQVSRHLANFKKEKLISLQGKNIIVLDRERLEAAANYFSE